MKSISKGRKWKDETVDNRPQTCAEVLKPGKDSDNKTRTLPVHNSVILTYDYDLSKKRREEMGRDASSFFDFLPIRSNDYRSRVFVRFAPNGEFKLLSNADTCFDPSLYILTFQGKDENCFVDITTTHFQLVTHLSNSLLMLHTILRQKMIQKTRTRNKKNFFWMEMKMLKPFVPSVMKTEHGRKIQTRIMSSHFTTLFSKLMNTTYRTSLETIEAASSIFFRYLMKGNKFSQSSAANFSLNLYLRNSERKSCLSANFSSDFSRPSSFLTVSSLLMNRWHTLVVRSKLPRMTSKS